MSRTIIMFTTLHVIRNMYVKPMESMALKQLKRKHIERIGAINNLLHACAA